MLVSGATGTSVISSVALRYVSIRNSTAPVVGLCAFRLGQRQRLAVEFSGAVLDRPRDREIGAHQRPRQTLVDRNIAPPDMVEHAQRIVGAVMHLDIAVDGRAGDELERRMQRREHDRHGVVGAGVDVEDELLAGHLATGIEVSLGSRRPRGAGCGGEP